MKMHALRGADGGDPRMRWKQRAGRDDGAQNAGRLRVLGGDSVRGAKSMQGATILRSAATTPRVQRQRAHERAAGTQRVGCACH
jgi:hypothetical protein